jgi:drug/metabolite transporter (DMT)-like permease
MSEMPEARAQTGRDTHTRTSFVLLIGLSVVWGLNWPIMKIALADFEPLTFRTLCIGAGAIGLAAIARAAGLSLAVPRREWKWLILASVCNILGWNILVVYGLDMMAAGRSVILAYTMPLWGVILSAVFLHERLTRRRGLGLVLGLCGLAVLMGSDIVDLQATPVGALLVVGAAISWAAGTVTVKYAKLTIPTTVLTAWQMIIALGPVAILALIVDGGEPPTMNLWPTLAVVYNMVLAFNFSYWAWFRIVAEVPVGVAAISTLVIPVIGLLAGAALLGEAIGAQELIALVLVVCALATALIPQGFLAWQRSGR